MDGFEDWLQFRRGEQPSPSPTHLPCAYCDALTAERGSVPHTFGDITCEGQSYTVCLGCEPALKADRA